MKYVDEIGEEPISYVKKIFEKITIERNKEVESAVLMEIQKIAIENGFETKFILNEKNILNALEKQIPKKPIIHGVREDRTVNTISYTCSVCSEHIWITEDYCKKCGQALDWSEE